MKNQVVIETVPDLLRTRVAASQDATACYHHTPSGWVPSTWRALAADVRQAAVAFHQIGLRKGDCLAILGRTGREWLVAELAGHTLGAVIVGIDPNASEEQATHILTHSGAKLLAADTQQNLERIPSACRAQLHGVIVWNAPMMADKNAARWPNLSGQPVTDTGPIAEVGPNDPATLVYTAGTTGKPKGIEYRHRHLLAAVRSAMRVWPEIGAGDTTLCWLPMAHQFQRMLNLWAIAVGMTTYFVEDPRTIADALRQVRPSFFAAVPRFYEKFAQGLQMAPNPAAAARALTGGNIKFMLTGSAPLAPWVSEFLNSVGLLVLEAYGVTESTVPMTSNRTTAYRFGSVGQAFDGNELKLDEDGEVLVRGPGLFDGYYQEEHRPPHLFTPDGFYRTGDLGRVDADGFWYLVGRKAEVIKTTTGRRISPTTVEAAYSKSRFVDQVVVFGHGRTHLVALVTLKPTVSVELGLDPTTSGEQLASDPRVKSLVGEEMKQLGQSLPAYEQVRHFAILPHPLSVEHGELTPTLKIRRRGVESRHADRIERLYQEASGTIPVPLIRSAPTAPPGG
jgi:long-chain acyl-CoA synthetase